MCLGSAAWHLSLPRPGQSVNDGCVFVLHLLTVQGQHFLLMTDCCLYLSMCYHHVLLSYLLTTNVVVTQPCRACSIIFCLLRRECLGVEFLQWEITPL
jgi:hypothetical protein